MKKLLFNIYLKLFSKKFFYRFNKALVMTGLKGMGILNYESFRISGEKSFLHYLSKNFKPRVIFDVGANTGSYTKICASIFPEASIFAFEPHPLTYLKLCGNIHSPNIKIFNLGFSDRPGTLALFDYETNDGSSHASLHEESFTRLMHEKTTSHTVHLSTIDSFLKEQGIGDIDFLKIDTEGHEHKVLLGAVQTINDKRIGTIQFEFGKPHIASRTFFKDIYDLLAEKYNIYRLLPSSMLPIRRLSLPAERNTYQNYVAILK